MDGVTARAASMLATAYRRRRKITSLPPDLVPQTALEAYAIQDRLVSIWGGHTIGWKLSCTSSVAQRALKFNKPCRGRVMAGAVDHSPAIIAGDKHFMRLIEPEFGFRLKHALPPSSAPFSFEHVEDAVEALIPVIEIVDTVYEDWASVGVLSLIADNMLSGGLILGEPVVEWRDSDLETHEVSLAVNGETVTAGHGGNVLNHPLNALVWLANDLPRMGMGLHAGEVIATGLSTGLVYAEAGDTAVADFGDWGRVTVIFTDV
tara:strand:- start:567 stop:1352 length:786 start_codon:yes stop_codon:yes gene_type:complete